MTTIYGNWTVGDTIILCASIDEFCGSYSQFINAKDIGIVKSPGPCNLTYGYERGCGLHLNNVEFTFKLVGISGSTEGKSCNPQKIYKIIGTSRTDSNGVATLTYTVTDQDRLSYENSIATGYPFKVIACITNPDGQAILSSQNSIVSDNITIAPIEVTHHLDLYVKPYSWYSQGGTADWLVSKLGDINGTLLNTFSNLGITNYQYIGTEILTEVDRPETVTIRIKLKQLSVMSMVALSVAPIIIAIAVVILIVGIIAAYRFYQWSGALVEGKQYTKKEVNHIVYDNVVPKQMDECEKNFSDPIQQTNCKKSAICGAANGLTDALKLNGTDCQTLQINEKVDACTIQYNIDHDLAKYKACVAGIVKDAGTETDTKIPKEADIISLLIYGGFILGGLYIISKPTERIVPTIYKYERERGG